MILHNMRLKTWFVQVVVRNIFYAFFPFIDFISCEVNLNLKKFCIGTKMFSDKESIESRNYFSKSFHEFCDKFMFLDTLKILYL